MKRRHHGRTRGFLLFEAILATMIFSLAVLALGRCVQNCVRAEMLLQDDDRGRRALDNRMTEIESGAVNVEDDATDELHGMFEGMKIHQSRVPMQLKNEKDEDVQGIDKITLELLWNLRGEKQARTLQFYLSSHQPNARP